MNASIFVAFSMKSLRYQLTNVSIFFKYFPADDHRATAKMYAHNMFSWAPIPTYTQRRILHMQIQMLMQTTLVLEREEEQSKPAFHLAINILRQTCQDYGYIDAASRLEELARLVIQDRAVMDVEYARWRYLMNAMIEQIDVEDKSLREWGWEIGLAGHWGTFVERRKEDEGTSRD